jgi:hypothetical protein
MRGSVGLLSGLFASVLFAIRQYRSLEFKVYRTELSQQRFQELYQELSEKLNLTLEYKTPYLAISTTRIRKNSEWGTVITTIHHKGEVYFNSVCDLYRRPSFHSFGQNQRNRELFDRLFKIGA